VYALRLPLSASVLEVPDELLLLGIHGNDRLPAVLKLPAFPVQIFELSVPVLMAGAFLRLLQALERVFKLFTKNLADGGSADFVAVLHQFLPDVLKTLTRPLQRSHWVSSCAGIHDFLDLSHDIAKLTGAL